MINPALFSSQKDDWETPQGLFDELNREFGFTLDVCATLENRKCAAYYNKQINGLEQPWHKDICWMNPPYGNPEYPCKPNCKKKKCQERGYHITEYIPGIIDWVKKAYEESLKEATIVCLLPARTDTRWFHEYIYGKAEIRFLQGRLKFVGAKNSAPFPSMIVVFECAMGVTP
jgi:site-specific DNA-methyltransferase (adenine-specific)